MYEIYDKMKRLLISLSFIVSFCFSYGQTPPVQTIGAPGNMVVAKGMLGVDTGFVLRKNYADTTALNLGTYLKYSPGAIVRTGDNIWQRSQDVTRWIPIGSGSISVDTTTTISLFGDGSSGSPLTADLLISSQNGNSLQSFADGAYVAQYIQNGLIDGGIVRWVSGYTYDVSPANYGINYVAYTSPYTQITLSNSDPTFDRIDLVVANTSNGIAVLEGTPSADPQLPSYDPAIQLPLAFILVTANTTEPTPLPNQDYIYLNNAEWTTLSSTARINVASTINPYSPTLDIEGTLAANGDNVTFTDPSPLVISDYNTLTLFIQAKSFWAISSQIKFQFFDGATPAGASVAIFNGKYGFSSSQISGYQLVSIPLSDFGQIVTATKLVMTVVTKSNQRIGFYVDNIQLQEANIPATGAVTSVGLSMPSAFTVTNSPITSTGVLTVTGAGTTGQYIRGDGTLATFPTTISGITADNGLTANTSTNARLGGTLLQTTTVNTAGFPTIFTGANTGSIITATNSSTGTAFSASAVNNNAYYGITTGSEVAYFTRNDANTNANRRVMTLERLTSGTSVNDISSSIDWNIENASGSSVQSGQIINKLTNVTAGAETSSWELWNINSGGALGAKFILAGNGALKLNAYTTSAITGTPTNLLATDASGNVIQTSLAGITASNALTANTSTNVQLGGTFLQNTTLDGGTLYKLDIIGDFSTGVNDALLKVINTGVSSRAIFAVASDGIGLEANSSSSFGVFSSSSSGIGIYAASTSSLGASIYSQSGVGAQIASDAGSYAVDMRGYGGGSNNTVVPVARIYANNGAGPSAAGFGARMDFELMTTNFATFGSANTLVSKWSDATHATRTSRFIITGVNSAVTAELFTLSGNGALKLNAYTTSAITGTAVNALATDAIGNIIQIALPAGGMTNPMTTANDLIYSADGAGTPARLAAGSANQVLAMNGAGTAIVWVTPGTGGTVTDFSIVNANGFSGSVATSTTTPALTVTTTITGILKGNGTAISAATAGTDYLTVLTGDATTSSNAITFATVNSNVGSFGSSTSIPTFTVNAKGLITAASGNVVIAPAGTLTGTTLNATVVSSSLTSVGALASGSLAAGFTAVGATVGGTGQSTYTLGDILWASATNTLAKLPIGTANQVLAVNAGATALEWTTLAGTGTVTSITLTQPSAGITITNSGVAITTSGTRTFALADDLAAVEGLATTGIVRRTGTSTWSAGTLVGLTTEVTGTLPVANGGTGQTSYTNGQLLIGNTTGNTLTKATLIAANGIGITNGTGSITVSTVFNPTVQTLTDGATITFNVTNGGNAVVTLAGTGRTLSITNPVAGYTYQVRIIQGSGGSKTITTWPTNTKWPDNGTIITLSTTAAEYDIVNFSYDGTNFYASYQNDYN